MTTTPIGVPIVIGHKPTAINNAIVSGNDARTGLGLVFVSAVSLYIATGQLEMFGTLLVATGLAVLGTQPETKSK